MLNSVLSPIPSHAMTCFKLPKSLITRIQSAVTRFWWDDKDGKKKIDWVSWTKMTQPKDKGGLGFRDFESFNDAYLAKLSWRLIHNPSCLLSRILQGKYFGNSSFLEASNKAVESHGWRGLMIGRDLILKNTGWVVGNGESINIWEAPWLSLEEKRRPMGPPPLTQLNMKVGHLLHPNRQDWNIEEIRRVLPQEEETILSLKPSKTGAPDKLIWLGTTSGEYTTRSGYETALKEQNANLEDPLATDINWVRDIWKI